MFILAKALAALTGPKCMYSSVCIQMNVVGKDLSGKPVTMAPFLLSDGVDDGAKISLQSCEKTATVTQIRS